MMNDNLILPTKALFFNFLHSAYSAIVKNQHKNPLNLLLYILKQWIKVIEKCNFIEE